MRGSTATRESECSIGKEYFSLKVGKAEERTTLFEGYGTCLQTPKIRDWGILFFFFFFWGGGGGRGGGGGQGSQRERTKQVCRPPPPKPA